MQILNVGYLMGTILTLNSQDFSLNKLFSIDDLRDGLKNIIKG
jgi:hypothetical protein